MHCHDGSLSGSRRCIIPFTSSLHTLMRPSILTGCCCPAACGETGECAEASELAGRDALLLGEGTSCSPAIPPERPTSARPTAAGTGFRRARSECGPKLTEIPGRYRPIPVKSLAGNRSSGRGPWQPRLCAQESLRGERARSRALQGRRQARGERDGGWRARELREGVEGQERFLSALSTGRRFTRVCLAFNPSADRHSCSAMRRLHASSPCVSNS